LTKFGSARTGKEIVLRNLSAISWYRFFITL